MTSNPASARELARDVLTSGVLHEAQNHLAELSVALDLLIMTPAEDERAKLIEGGQRSIDLLGGMLQQLHPASDDQAAVTDLRHLLAYLDLQLSSRGVEQESLQDPELLVPGDPLTVYQQLLVLIEPILARARAGIDRVRFEAKRTSGQVELSARLQSLEPLVPPIPAPVQPADFDAQVERLEDGTGLRIALPLAPVR